MSEWTERSPKSVEKIYSFSAALNGQKVPNDSQKMIHISYMYISSYVRMDKKVPKKKKEI